MFPAFHIYVEQTAKVTLGQQGWQPAESGYWLGSPLGSRLPRWGLGWAQSLELAAGNWSLETKETVCCPLPPGPGSHPFP